MTVLTPSAGAVHDTSPFLGLAFYTEAEARYFFGRTAERRRIIANLRTSRLTVLYAESGVGKSSLLRAGVVARLRDLATASIRQRGAAKFVPVVFSAWKDDPIAPLVTEIGRQSAAFVLDPQASGGESEQGELARAVARAGAATRGTVVLILDQFEEHFRYRHDHPEPDRLADEIAECVNTPGLPVHFLIALREDAYGGLGDLLRGRIANVYKNYIHLEYLGRSAAREAILQPIAVYNEDHDAHVVPQEGLVSVVLDEVQRGRLVLGQGMGEPSPRSEERSADGAQDPDEIEAPFLQLVMDRLWRKERAAGSDELRTDTLQRGLGGAERIVRDHLSDALRTLKPEELAIAPPVFAELVTPSGAKVAHTAPDLAAMAGAPETQITALLSRLDNERIVRRVDAAPGTNAERYEIFHDKLAAPILEWVEARRTAALEAEAEARARQARRLRRLAVLLALAVVAVAIVAVVVVQQKATISRERAAAVRERSAALRAGTLASYFALRSTAQGQLAARPDVALLLFLAAYEQIPGAQAQRSLIATLQSVALSGTTGLLHGHTDVIGSLSFSAAASVLASAGADGTVRLWHVDAGRHYPVGRPLHAGSSVFSAAVSPDGRQVAAGTFGAIVIWDRLTGAMRRISDPGGPVTSVAYDPRGHTLAAASTNGTVLLFDSVTGRSTLLRDPGASFRSVAFSPDGSMLAAGGTGGDLTLWSGIGWRTVTYLRTHGRDVYAVAFSSDSATLAAAGAGGVIVLWSTADHRIRTRLVGPASNIYSLAFSPSDATIAAGESGLVVLWDTRSDRPLGAPLAVHEGPVYGVAFSPDGGTLASAGADRMIALTAIPVRRPYGSPLPTGALGGVATVAVAPNGLIAAGASDGTVSVLHSPARHAVTFSVPRGLHALAFADDGQVLAAAGQTGGVQLYSPLTGRQLGPSLGADQGAVYALGAPPRGRLVVSGGKDGTVRLWDVQTHRAAGPVLMGNQAPVYAVAISADGREVASGGNDRTVRIWRRSAAGWRPVRVLGQATAIFAVSFSPDGRLVASGGGDDAVHIWRVAGASPGAARTLLGHGNTVRSVAFSPDGLTLASSGSDDTVRLWDVASGTELGPPFSGDTGSVESVAFTPGGRFVVSGSRDHTVRAWPAVTAPAGLGAVRDEVCAFVGAGLSTSEWHEYAPDVLFQSTCPRATP